MKKLLLAAALLTAGAGFAQQNSIERYPVITRYPEDVLWHDADHRHLHHPVDHIMYVYRLNDYVFSKRKKVLSVYFQLKSKIIPYGVSPKLNGKKFTRRAIAEYNDYYNRGWAKRSSVFNTFTSEKCRNIMSRPFTSVFSLNYYLPAVDRTPPELRSKYLLPHGI